MAIGMYREQGFTQSSLSQKKRAQRKGAKNVISKELFSRLRNLRLWQGQISTSLPKSHTPFVTNATLVGNKSY